MKGTITISRTQGTYRAEFISIRVSDENARTNVVELEISLEDFAKAITGQFSECDLVRVPSPESAAKFGLTCEVQTGHCEKVGYEKGEQQAEVVRHFEEHWKPLGWELSNDGTGTQQNAKMHHYGVRRWVKKGTE